MRTYKSNPARVRIDVLWPKAGDIPVFKVSGDIQPGNPATLRKARLFSKVNEARSYAINEFGLEVA